MYTSTVSSGQTVTGEIVSTGSGQDVQSGGTAVSGSVFDFCSQSVEGRTSGMMIGDYGIQIVNAGGVTVGTLVDDYVTSWIWRPLDSANRRP